MPTTVRTMGSDDARPLHLGVALHSKYTDSLPLSGKGIADIKTSILGSVTSRCSTPGSDVSNVFTTPPSSIGWSTSTSQDIDSSESVDMRDEDSDVCSKRNGGRSPKSVNDSASNDGRSLPFRHEGPLQPGSSLRRACFPAFDQCSDDQDSEMSESDAEDYEDDESEDNDWSGDNGSLEETVIAAVDGDLALAAYLIPLLHKDINSGVKSKVESWQNTAGSGSGSSSGGQVPSHYSVSPSNSPSNPRKRRRSAFGSQIPRGGGDDGEDDEDGGASNAGGGPVLHDDTQQILFLACPFHKLDPTKYSQHSVSGTGKRHDYRACAGPGFRTIQRLKEHLKRRHYPVQCDRCYQIFQGSDRATCVEQLLKHRQADDPCERKDPNLKEGISDAQWVALEKQNRKRNQETHRVEKWFEIWTILFPKDPSPETPWYDGVVARPQLISPTGNRDTFVQMFLAVLDHKMKSGDIAFQTGDGTMDMREKLKNVVVQTFTLFTSLHGPLSPTETSSSLTGTNPFSVVGGSSTHMSRPSNAQSQQMTTATVSTMPSSTGQSYTLNITNAASPQGYTMIPMTRQPSQFQSPMPTQMSPAPAMPTQVPMSNFTAMSQQDLSNYWMFSGQPWPANGQFQAIPTMFPGSGQIGVGEADFYGQTQNYGQGPPDDDFGTMQ